MTDNGWTPERRKRQTEMIKSWKPWKQSTGPKSEEGKESCKMNAQKHGGYSAEMKALRGFLRKQDNILEELLSE